MPAQGFFFPVFGPATLYALPGGFEGGFLMMTHVLLRDGRPLYAVELLEHRPVDVSPCPLRPPGDDALHGVVADGVAHFAHLGGMGFGLLWFLYFTPGFQLSDLKRRIHKRRTRNRLKVIRLGEEEEEENSGPTIH